MVHCQGEQEDFTNDLCDQIFDLFPARETLSGRAGLHPNKETPISREDIADMQSAITIERR